MKRIISLLLALFFLSTQAIAGMNDFLNSLNIQARADMNGFTAKICTQFGVPEVQVRTVIGTVKEPADAFMVFQLGQMAQKPPETVVQSYKANQGKGWGVIAKSLGIKPGSPEFHALKRGDFALTGVPGEGPGGGHGKGKGKGKGHN
jgi:hypothetical protein